MSERQTLVMVAALLALLLLGCLVIGLGLLFFLPAEGPQPDTPPGPPGSLPPGTPGNETNQTDGGLSKEDLETWNMITKQKVESICIQKAKQEAQGNAGFVYGCTCDETVRTERKTYACDIDTADPFTQYFANVDCYYVGAYCVIETNYGKDSYTFAQLRQLA